MCLLNLNYRLYFRDGKNTCPGASNNPASRDDVAHRACRVKETRLAANDFI